MDDRVLRCKRCGTPLQPGIAIEQTFTPGLPDFPGETVGRTMHVGGPGNVVGVQKCPSCGWSVRK